MRPTPDLIPVLPAKADGDWRGSLQVKTVTEPDAWLDATYGLLRRHFADDVVEPKERFVKWLDQNRRGVHPFPFVLLAAYLAQGGRARVIGALAGNLMRLVESRPESAKPAPATYFFAVGNQLTDPLAKRAGIKGVGTRLWRRSITEARSITRKLGGHLDYSFLEAETDSLGFWERMGYRWPRGVTYWQPPLEFDARGKFLHPEVPEIAMFKPLGSSPRRTIGKQLVHDVIATIFLNWALHPYRATLSPAAMKRAEGYVMGTLMGRVDSLMPPTPRISLVPFPREHAGS